MGGREQCAADATGQGDIRVWRRPPGKEGRGGRLLPDEARYQH